MSDAVPRRSARTGVQVSRFGLGTMVLGVWGNSDRAECARIIHRALDAGINLVDTADVYGAGENEEIVGGRSPGGATTSCWPPSSTARWATTSTGGATRGGGSTRAIDDSLRRLGVDHVDLYQIHRPDPSTPIDETVGALDDLVRAGKIRYWGTSTFPAEELVEARWAAERRQASPVRTPSSRRTRSSAGTSSATSCRCASATASACSCGARCRAAG